MKAVTELVKQGAQLVMGNEGRGVRSRLGEISHHTYEWSVLFAVLEAKSLEFSHPSAASFRSAREEVCIEESLVDSVPVLYVVDAHVLMIYRKVVALFELKSVEPACQ